MRLNRFGLALMALALAALSGCTPQQDMGVTKNATGPDALPQHGVVLPFRPAPGLAVRRPNDQIAQDFLDLEFHMESGQALPVLTRFEGSITVAMAGAVPPTARADVLVLIRRLKAEAGLDLTLLADGSPAALTLNFERKALLHRIDPSAACFVVPNVSTLSEYRRRRGSEDLDWTGLRLRTRAAVFLPGDASPQEIRDCLHEETAQALGPVNDLYRLPDSVFNDDNFQSVLTGFDMLMLRLHYAPDFTNGMSEAEVTARLPEVLARLNPGGAGSGTWSAPDTLRVWLDQVGLALNGAASSEVRYAAARRSLSIALGQGWQDNRLGFSYYILGRMQAPRGGAGTASAYDAAEADYAAAARIYQTLPDEGVHLAHALMQLAAIALARGQEDQAIALADRTMPLARVAQNAALLATVMLIKAEALAATGHGDAARELRLDSLAAARYGFGAEPEIRARAAEIAALAQQNFPG
ncbi:MAG: DUF2927 domain-containing protein [Cypionkella sp.]